MIQQKSVATREMTHGITRKILQAAIDDDIATLATASGLTSKRTRVICRRLQRRIAMRNALRAPSDVRQIEKMRGIA